MNKVKCINGHYFDLDRFRCCPTCGGAVDSRSARKAPKSTTPSVGPSRVDDVDKTAPMPTSAKNKEQEVEQPTDRKKVEPPYPVVSDLAEEINRTGADSVPVLPKTTYVGSAEVDPPVGWLVCVEGVYQGQAFACRTDWNRIGRNANCEINLAMDDSITREPSARILFEKTKRIFFLNTDAGRGVVYLNGEVLMKAERLNAYDKIQIGKAVFVFLPLCGERFSWDDYIN